MVYYCTNKALIERAVYPGTNESIDKYQKAEKIKLLKAIQKPIDYNLIALTHRSLLGSIVRRIPWLSRFLLKFDDAADSLVRIGEGITDANNSFGNEAIAHGFHISGVIIAAFDFIRIPIIYFAAFLFNEKIPLKLDNNLRMVYSFILLSLAITAVAAPVTAPVISFVTTSAGLGIGVFLLGKTIYSRYRLAQERKSVNSELEIEESLMHSLQEEAKLLENLFLADGEEEQIIELISKLTLLQERYCSQKNQLLILKNKELQVEHKIKDIGVIRFLDKSISVSLTILSLIGLTLALFVPPVGLWILVGAALMGGVYLFGRLATPLIKFLGNCFSNLVAAVTREKNSLPHEMQDSISPHNKDIPVASYDKGSSTTTVLMTLLEKETVDERADKIKKELNQEDCEHEMFNPLFLNQSKASSVVIKKIEHKEGNSETALDALGKY